MGYETLILTALPTSLLTRWERRGNVEREAVCRLRAGAPLPDCPCPPDLPMQQNMALSEFNGQSGYLLKHEFMRRSDKQFKSLLSGPHRRGGSHHPFHYGKALRWTSSREGWGLE